MKTPVSEKAGPSTESPKTPGGIRKSLLTPCRRVGLSRKWRGSGVSPFISPLGQNNTPTDNECDENVKKDIGNVDTTPSRPIRKKSIRKTLSSGSKSIDISDITEESPLKSTAQPQIDETSLDTDMKDTETYEGTPQHTINTVEIEESTQNTDEEVKVKMITRKKSSKLSLRRIVDTDVSLTSDMDNTIEPTENREADSHQKAVNVKKITRKKSSKKSPNNLMKECLVVIDRNLIKPTNNSDIFNSDLDDTPLSDIRFKENVNKSTTADEEMTEKKFDTTKSDEVEIVPINTITDEILPNANNKSQLIFNTDQDTPLTNTMHEENLKDSSDDDDFVEIITKKISHKNTSTTDLRKRRTQDATSQNSLDEVTNKRKTILIRKSYGKPTRAKSMGSITLRDLQEMKARIEQKQELLLAKTFTEDTIELQELIRKWRTGCQEALSELMDLMKKKFPEKHNMDYSELLEMLKIPINIVGYDPERDCFKSPHEFNVFGF